MVKRRRCGFVMSEGMLIVGLLTFVIPSLMIGVAQGRRDARKAVCKTNLKGFVNALVIYQDAFSNKYPSFGNEDKKIDAAPTAVSEDSDPAKFVKAGDNLHCNLQPMWLLHDYSALWLEGFTCPSDSEAIGPKWQAKGADMKGFDDWHNDSYAFGPISSAYGEAQFDGKVPDTGMFLIGDRPRPGSLKSGSANHPEGANFLCYNGAVLWETTNVGHEAEGKNVYLLDMGKQKANQEVFLHFEKDNTTQKPENSTGKAAKG